MLADRVNGTLRHVPPWVIYVLGLLPLAILIVQAITGGLGADPVKALERSLGLYGLQFLVATLCVTPIRRLTRISLQRYRRALGILTFVYVALHFTVWIVLDLQFRWAEIGTDLVKRPYVVVGFAAFLLMVPLVATSNNASVRRLGAAAWQRLHWLTYPAAVLGAVHFVWLTKTWQAGPMLYLLGVTVLLATRGAWALRRRVARAT